MLKRDGCWASCAVCGYSPRTDEDSLTKHFLASDNFYRETELEDIAVRIQAGKPLEFPAELLRERWINKAEVDELFRQGEALDRGECPKCAAVVTYVTDGGSVGWVCSTCGWGIWTSSPDA
jgi:hypothetical protein